MDRSPRKPILLKRQLAPRGVVSSRDSYRLKSLGVVSAFTLPFHRCYMAKHKNKLLKIKAKSVKNWAWFANQCNAWNLDLMVFNAGRHLRANGNGWIDYWPSTGKWWSGKGKGSKDELLLANALKNISPKPKIDNSGQSYNSTNKQVAIIKHPL